MPDLPHTDWKTHRIRRRPGRVCPAAAGVAPLSHIRPVRPGRNAATVRSYSKAIAPVYRSSNAAERYVAGQRRCPTLWLEADTDPVRFPVFLTERTPQLKIDRLPCDNAAQGAAYGGAGAGKRRVLLGQPAAGALQERSKARGQNLEADGRPQTPSGSRGIPPDRIR